MFEPHDLSPEHQATLDEIKKTFYVASKEGYLPCTDKIKHNIDTGDAKPIRVKSRAMSPPANEKFIAEVNRLEKRGIVKRVHFSEWLNPMICVKKPDGSVRLCTDARGLNSVTKKNTYQPNNINTIFATIKNPVYISCLDYTEAFFQIPLDEDSVTKTAFAVPGKGTYVFTRAAMGLSGSGATLNALVDTILADLSDCVCTYLDDVFIWTDTIEKHFEVLREVAKRLREAGLGISDKKTHLAMRKVKFLGFVIDKDGLHINDEKLDPILNFEIPRTQRHVRKFMGMVGWFRRFIPDFADISAPINELTKTQYKQKFIWTPEADKAFRELKIAMTTTPVLALPDYNIEFTIHSDCSNVAAGAVLTQVQEGKEKVIAYMSQKLTPQQQKYMTTEKECLAVLISFEKFRHYIEGAPNVTVITDHAALMWLKNMKDPKNRLARWALLLQSYPYNIIHRKGKFHALPDVLSRLHEDETVEDISEYENDEKFGFIDLELLEVVDKPLLPSLNVKKFTETNDEWYLSTRKATIEEDLTGKTYAEIQYTIIDGVLYRNKPRNDKFEQQDLKICVPQEYRNEIMNIAHDLKESGPHNGYWKMLHRVSVTYYWPSMSKDIGKFVKTCELCRTCKHSRQAKKVPMGKYRNYVQPFRVISCDFVGPFPISKNYKNTQLCVVTCNFSKFCILRAMKNATADNLIEFLEKEVFKNFGVPEKFVCDQGVQFISDSFEEFLKYYGVQLNYCSVYNPKANPTEILNKSIGDQIRIYIQTKNGNQRLWDENLVDISRNLNSSPHTITGVSPAFAVFNQTMKTHAGQYKLDPENGTEKSVDEENAKANVVRTNIQEKLLQAHNQNTKRYNLRSNVRTFKTGDVVYIPNRKLSDKSKYYDKKLDILKVAVEIDKQIGTNTYTVKVPQGKKFIIKQFDAKDFETLNDNAENSPIDGN